MGKNAKHAREQLLKRALDDARPENREHPQQNLLPNTFIDRLLDAGLYLDKHPTFVSSHVGTPSGYAIVLPENSGGNRSIKHESAYQTPDGKEAKTCMPAVVLWGNGQLWHTQVLQFVPGPGPGDFRHEFMSLEEAFADITNYFFDPKNVHFQALWA